MACCYIAASMIAFIINSCAALNVDLNLQYNESLDPSKPSMADQGGLKASEKDSNGPTTLSLGGMTCAACTGNLERAIGAIDGVERVVVSLLFQEAKVIHDPSVQESSLVSAVEDAGYEASIGERAPQQRIETLQHNKELQSLAKAFAGSSQLASALFLVDSGVAWFGWSSYVDRVIPPLARQSILLCLSMAISFHYGLFIHRSTWSQAKKLSVNMNTLISLSTTLGIILSIVNTAVQGPAQAYTYFQTVSGLTLIVTAGRYLDLLSRRQATNTFVGLYELLHETGSVKVIGQKQPVPPSMLTSKDKIAINPYTMIPCDGYVIKGTSTANESIITGESIPRTKCIGDFLLAGTRNGPGYLEANVNQDQQGSFLSQLIRSVENASTSKATAQEWVEQITQWFVLTVLFIACTASARSFYALGDDTTLDLRLTEAGQKMMSILAAACPCALGLATPCAIMAGIDVAWRKGVLMTEGAAAMENLAKVTHVIMDKTGTLTMGDLRITNFRTSSAWGDKPELLSTYICAAEENSASSHPVGAAVFKESLQAAGGAWQKFKHYGGLRNVSETPGRGVKCDVDIGDAHWRTVCVGSLALLRQEQVTDMECIPAEVDALGTLVFVAIDGKLAASLLFQDTLRPDALSTIESLKARGLSVTMLTGDNPLEATRISQMLDIPVLASAARPQQKLEYVKRLQVEGDMIAMIGDGINDGPSLATADVGIMIAHGRRCLSAGGSVLILASRLQSLLTLFHISDQTMKQVSANIKWALIYNAVAVSLASGIGQPWGIHISPTVAAAMMSMSSLAITYRGISLRERLLAEL